LKKILLLTIASLIVGYFLLNKNDSASETNSSEEKVMDEAGPENKMALNQIIQSELEDSNKTDEESKINELEGQWQQELRNHLTEIDPEDADYMFTQYLEASKEKAQKNAPLLMERQKYLQLDNSQTISLEDKKKFIELDKVLDQNDEEYKARIKKILGGHFESSLRVYNDFIENFVSHHQGQGKVSLDIAFSAKE
jgi:hypothetical protein